MTQEDIIFPVPKNIELPYLRHEVIRLLLEYSWVDYQVYVMTMNNSYVYNFYNNYKTIEWLFMGDCDYPSHDADDAKPDYNAIGEVYRNRKEAELMFKFCILNDKLSYAIQGDLCMRQYEWVDDDVYFNSPFWPKMVKAAQEAFAEFMKNEEYDEGYTVHIEGWKISMQKEIDDRKAELARTGKKPY